MIILWSPNNNNNIIVCILFAGLVSRMKIWRYHQVARAQTVFLYESIRHAAEKASCIICLYTLFSLCFFILLPCFYYAVCFDLVFLRSYFFALLLLLVGRLAKILPYCQINQMFIYFIGRLMVLYL